MNKVLEFVKSRSWIFWLRIVMMVFAVAPIVYMIGRSGVESKYILSVVFAGLALVAQILACVFEKKRGGDYIELAGVVLLCSEFATFLSAGILSIVDFIYGINFWGDATQFPFILIFGLLLLAATVISVVCCFLGKTNEKNS
ncbi:MAG: hypothetical protein J6D37_08615 [Clostridia bacterium]|nr:hypothetical protein [Clostridia bacterium]